MIEKFALKWVTAWKVLLLILQRVCVLADRGINEKIDQSAWDTIVADLTSGIARDRNCEEICDAIEKIGAILEAYFPYQKDDRDELHNLIIR